MWTAARESGLMTIILCSGCVACFERGSYDGEANWQLEKNAAEYLATLGPIAWNDAYLSSFLPGVKEDRDEDPSSLCAEEACQILRGIPQRRWLQVKPMQVALTRWCTWHDSMERDLIPNASEKAMVCGVHLRKKKRHANTRGGAGWREVGRVQGQGYCQLLTAGR